VRPVQGSGFFGLKIRTLQPGRAPTRGIGAAAGEARQATGQGQAKDRTPAPTRGARRPAPAR